MTDGLSKNGSTRGQALARRMDEIADGVAALHADAVDRDARFPHETFAALRQAGMLSAGVPEALGGAGCALRELAELCTILAQRCASSAMILAMHYIQVACIVRYRDHSAPLADYLRRLAAEQRLIASVTSEVGTDGDMRRSITALQSAEGRVTCTKHATTVSYGLHADDLLLTARRADDAPDSDQRLILALSGGYRLDSTGAWDTLGMRGTCSPGGVVTLEGESWQVLPAPFGDIAAATMVPVSHILWSACWLGIATDAAARARAIVQRKARSDQRAALPAAARLANVDGKLQLMRGDLGAVIREHEDATATADARLMSSLGLAIRYNNLKLNSSRLVVEIVTEALEICGISAYRNDSESSLGRHLRDALSAPLMISNDRIRQNTATLHMVYKNR
ncbi:MAG: acyl-CoA dehydrogenase family protein [Pseudomonadales bacterium]